jgi:hypothetical protein
MPWQDLPKFSAVSVGAGQSIVCPTLPDGKLVSHLYTRRGDLSQRARKEENHAVHDHLERTSAGLAHRVRKCTEANSGGLQPV